MKKDDLYDALSGINKNYIAESDDFKAVSKDFRKQRIHKNRVIASTLCLAFVGVGVIGIFQSGILKRNFHTAEKEINTISSAESTTDTSAVMTEQPIISEPQISDEPLYYSKLVKNIETPKLDGYDASASLDIIGFDESMLKDSVGVIEGEIIDLWVNHYEYATACDKFEPNGLLYHKQATVAYTIRVDKVFNGNFTIGDVVTVEDYHFVCDSIVSIKKGSSYVIPIGKSDGKLHEPDEIVSGDTALESCYYTLYQFHPQIEKVSGGYAVPDDWKSLTTDECAEIIMDIGNAECSYNNRPMYFVPDSTFNYRMNLILQNNEE